MQKRKASELLDEMVSRLNPLVTGISSPSAGETGTSGFCNAAMVDELHRIATDLRTIRICMENLGKDFSISWPTSGSELKL